MIRLYQLHWIDWLFWVLTLWVRLQLTIYPHQLSNKLAKETILFLWRNEKYFFSVLRIYQLFGYNLGKIQLTSMQCRQWISKTEKYFSFLQKNNIVSFPNLLHSWWGHITASKIQKMPKSQLVLQSLDLPMVQFNNFEMVVEVY